MREQVNMINGIRINMSSYQAMTPKEMLWDSIHKEINLYFTVVPSNVNSCYKEKKDNCWV